MSTWLTIFKLLLTVADKIGDIVRAQQLLSAGGKIEVANQLAAIAQRVGATDEIRNAVAALTDEEIDEELGRTDPL